MLSQIFDKKKTQSIIDIMPDSMIVWKVVTDSRIFDGLDQAITRKGMIKKRWHPAFTFVKDNLTWFPFEGGYNENNVWGYHCFIKKNEVQQYKEHFNDRSHIGYWNMVSAKIEKKDIMKVGIDRGKSLTILTSRIIMPTYPNTDITKEITEDCNLIENHEQVVELMSDNLCLVDV